MSTFTQLCVWPGCIVLGPGILPTSQKGIDAIKEFEKVMADEFSGTRVQYVEEILTLPDRTLKGDPVPGTGGRTDLFFYVHVDDISKFAVPRMAIGIRWWEDVLNNGGGVLYPQRILEKYPKSW
jgi:hypothetical protein